jgi:hypothetical protein
MLRGPRYVYEKGWSCSTEPRRRFVVEVNITTGAERDIMVAIVDLPQETAIPSTRFNNVLNRHILTLLTRMA